MFVIVLRFADKSKAPSLMEEHNAWLRRGFEEGAFVLAGSVQPNQGGAVFALGARADVEARVGRDPFVAEGVVKAEILEIAPNRCDERLAFLKA